MPLASPGAIAGFPPFGFHPVIEAWFRARFDEPTPVQAQAWPLIAAGRDVLLTAPTGSGKTLAAFLSCLDRLFRRAVEGRLEARPTSSTSRR